MKTQIHTGRMPKKEEFQVNTKCWMFVKPKKALWTSSMLDHKYKLVDYLGKHHTAISYWEDYVLNDYAEFYSDGSKRENPKKYILTPCKDVRILEFNLKGYENNLYSKYLTNVKESVYGHSTPFYEIDYDKVMEDYDAVHFEYSDAIDETPYWFMVYGLNCECTVWLRWVFESVEEYKEGL